MNIKELELALSTNLKKFEKDKDNRIGIIYELRDAKNHELAIIKMNNYLDNPSTSKTRNNMIKKAKEISKNT